MASKKMVKGVGKASLPVKKKAEPRSKTTSKKATPARKKTKSPLKKKAPAPLGKRRPQAKKNTEKKSPRAVPTVKKRTAVKKKETLKKKKTKKPTRAAPVTKKKILKKSTKKQKTEKALRKKKKQIPKLTTPSRPKRKKPVRRSVKLSAREESLRKALREDISTVLVTGASNCIGIFLVQHLLRKGYSVVAVDRRVKEIPGTQGKKLLVLKSGNLLDSRFAASCLDGVDAVLHPAVLSETKQDRKAMAFYPGTETHTLFTESRKRGVKRFIHIGSAAVYKRISGRIAEDGHFESRTEYEQYQIETERFVSTQASPGLPLVTVLRAASIYGPGPLAQMAWVATLPPLVKTLGHYYLKLSGGPRINLVHGEDVARAAVFLLTHPKACGETFNIGDNDPMLFSEIINRAMEIYGLKPLKAGVPYPPSTLLQSILPYVANEEIFSPLTDLSSLLWDRMARKQKLIKELSPRMSPENHSFGARDIVLDNRKLLGLGFRLKYPRFERGWKKTIEWQIKNRWVPRPDEL